MMCLVVEEVIRHDPVRHVANASIDLAAIAERLRQPVRCHSLAPGQHLEIEPLAFRAKLCETMKQVLAQWRDLLGPAAYSCKEPEIGIRNVIEGEINRPEERAAVFMQ